GYEVRMLPAPRVHVLAVNQRRAPLAQAAVRRALAYAIDRDGLLNRHFRGPASGAAKSSGPAIPHHAANGPFPAGSWACAAPPRAPATLDHPERARSLARQAKATLDNQEWTLKYPNDDPRVAAALEELAEQVERVVAASGVKVKIRPLPLSP